MGCPSSGSRKVHIQDLSMILMDSSWWEDGCMFQTYQHIQDCVMYFTRPIIQGLQYNQALWNVPRFVPIFLVDRAEERCFWHHVKMSSLSAGKIEHQRPRRLLQPLALPKWKSNSRTCDFLTHLPTSHHQMDPMWVIIDRLTKLTHLMPIWMTYPVSIPTKLHRDQIVRLHGVPREIVSYGDPKIYLILFGNISRESWILRQNLIQLIIFRPMTSLRELSRSLKIYLGNVC